MNDLSNRGFFGHRTRMCFASASVIALFAGVGVAGAQTAPAKSPSIAVADTTVSDVVVTASRRGNQNVQNVPLAVDAYSGKTLEKYNLQSIQDLSKIDPSLSVQNFGATQQQIIIRGISSSVGRTTGIYLDEAPLQGGFNANNNGDGSPGLRLHDVEHIEVLKGPQGTLFGAGSMDGTLRVISNKPNLERYEGSFETTAASIDHGEGYFDGDAMVNIPLVTDKFAIRGVAWGESGGGFIDQTIAGVTRNNVNQEHLAGGRIEALWKPMEKLSILAAYNSQTAIVDGAQAWTSYVGATDSPGGARTGPYPAYQNHSPSQEPYLSHYNLATLTADYGLDYGDVVATLTDGRLNQLQFSDTSPSDCSYTLCSSSAAFPASYSAREHFTDMTAELRFSSKFNGPLQIVTGAYYERDILRYSGAVLHGNPTTGALACDTFDRCNADGLNVAGSSPVEFANSDHFNVDQYTVYAQADYQLPFNLTATVGARYFAANIHDFQIDQENIAPTVTPYGFDGGYFLGDVTKPYTSSTGGTHETKPTYNFSLLYAPTSNVSLYVRAASGFRIGGVNETATIAAEEGIAVPGSFAPDSLWDYEGGAKIYLLDRKLHLDLAVYHIDWSNQQVDALADGIYNYTLNVGKTTTDGVELSADYHPITGLTLSGDFTYVDAKLAEDLPNSVVEAGTPGKSGDQVPFVPHVSFSFQGEYEHPITDMVNGYLQTDFTYHGESHTAFRASTAAQIAAGGNDFDDELPAYFLMDMRAGVRFGRYDLSLFVQNLTNEVAYVGDVSHLDATQIFSARPRTVGVHLSAHF